MKISMWILVDQLREYHPKYSILSGECVLQAVRLFGSEDSLSPATVYLCRTTDIIETAKAGVMCVNQNDYVYLETLDVADVFNKIMRTFDDYRLWENELEQLITDGKSIQDMITASSRIFKNPLIVGDAAYRILALDSDERKFVKNRELYQHIQKRGNLSIKDMSLVNQEQMKHLTRKSPYLLVNENLPGTDGIIRNLFAHGKSRFGMMILKDEQGFTKGEIQLFDILGGFLEKWLKKNIAVSSVSALSQMFINLIRQEDVDPGKYLELLEGNGWNQDEQKRLIVITPCRKVNSALNYLENYYRDQFKDSHVFLLDSKVVLLARQTAESEPVFFEDLKKHLLLSECHCGVSYLFTFFTDLRNHYEAARVALEYGSENAGAVNYCADFILSYVKDIVKKHTSCDISLSVLKQLRLHDSRYDTDYYHTLYLYLINERNKAKTSKELYIHRNTLLHRLEKIQEIINMDLDIPENRFKLLVSYMLKQ